MYSTAQIHKPLVNNFSLDLHSVINTPIHGWEKFFVPLLRFNLSDFNIKDSFEFTNDTIEFWFIYGICRYSLTFYKYPIK